MIAVDNLTLFFVGLGISIPAGFVVIGLVYAAIAEGRERKEVRLLGLAIQSED